MAQFKGTILLVALTLVFASSEVFEDDEITQKIIDYVNPAQIREYLSDLTGKPHLGGTEENNILAEYVKNVWVQQGLDQVKYNSYEVLLSYPDWENLNKVDIVVDATDEIVYSAEGRQTPLHSAEESDPTVIPNFNAYSRSGRVKGDLVYVHYGTKEDFEWVAQQGIDLAGKIVIARYGDIFRGNIAQFAKEYNASGLIIYSDPEDYAQNGKTDVYPYSTWLPGSGTQSGTLFVPYGDPLTPRYPAVEGAYRISIEDADVPQIPVQPIGYNDAEQFLSRLGGVASPADWKGTLNASYNIGPGFSDTSLKVVLDIKTHDQIANITNVIGVIRGSIEPDRYVVISNHRDAWVFGAIDPSSGTAAMLEISRVFGELMKEGWRPRRSILFASWDAEEYGLIGSAEWVQEHLKVLMDQAVACLNVDMSVEGGYSLRAKAVPTVYRVVYDSAKKIPNPNPEEVAAGRLTVYDTWLYRNADFEAPNRPWISPPGSGSDYAPFLHLAGVPVLDYRYVDNHVSPLYHTLYETFYDVDVLVDPGFKYHGAIAQLWAETARNFADSSLLPFNVEDYATYLQHAFQDITADYGPQLQQQNISLGYLQIAIDNFAASAQSFHQQLLNQNLTNILALRSANDKLMQVERAFLQPEGLPDRPYLRHVVLAPSESDQYGASIFAGVTDLINSASSPEDWELVKKELASTVYFVDSAASVLQIPF